MCRAWLEHDRPCPRTYGAPGAATLDGDLVAFGHDGSPDFPLLCERMLMRRPGIVVTYKIFDLVTIDRRGLLRAPYCARLRRRLVSWFGPTSLAAVRPRDVAAFVAGHELGTSVVRRDLDVPTASSSRRRRRSSSKRIRRKVRSGRTEGSSRYRPSGRRLRGLLTAVEMMILTAV